MSERLVIEGCATTTDEAETAREIADASRRLAGKVEEVVK